ncbi:aminopeptidase P family protein [Jatrophihabitans lederbergiae]|uniref:Xaa-Pro aminopeptidase n=1 Tax=Jatrophihabitans lederbergiae TaxID=3075547 RepID=A0ABU2JB66_9ACTN|nr:aminopeptidase P family protein [Jatrophihabitans sp. DSM 44399]MDT0261894.1 aminopeptidase P family protein [Jatrophihabitans sp. DSM 44399]
MSADTELTPLSETTEQDDAEGTTSHDLPLSAGLAKAISENWEAAPRMPHPANRSGQVTPGADTYARNRAALSAAFSGELVAVPAGVLKVRANDTDYEFRAWSGFSWLTGETVEGAVLVLAPAANGTGHEAALYIREYAGPGETGYFTDRLYGALWVGNVPTVEDTATVLDLPVRPLSELARDLRAYGGPVAAPRGIDPQLDALLPGARAERLEQVIDELRLTKDAWEIEQLQAACDATARGFTDVVGEIPAVLAAGGRRGERWLEGTFWRRARMEGNEVGYGSILGAGRHATTLHWWRNDGNLDAGQLLLADMGVEVDSLFTADVTRTMPVGGEWSDTQRTLYNAVLEAQEAGISEVKAGAEFLSAHKAAMWVLADHLHSWGILPVTADVACAEDPEAPGAGLHRRYTLHGVSHMLGIDVHDCAAARDETYRNGALSAGYVLTVEPGLYFQPNDLSVPAEWRGIGIRIEDDILVTDGAPVNLSASLPRDPDEITAWMRDAQSRPVAP